MDYKFEVLLFVVELYIVGEIMISLHNNALKPVGSLDSVPSLNPPKISLKNYRKRPRSTQDTNTTYKKKGFLNPQLALTLPWTNRYLHNQPRLRNSGNFVKPPTPMQTTWGTIMADNMFKEFLIQQNIRNFYFRRNPPMPNQANDTTLPPPINRLQSSIYADNLFCAFLNQQFPSGYPRNSFNNNNRAMPFYNPAPNNSHVFRQPTIPRPNRGNAEDGTRFDHRTLDFNEEKPMDFSSQPQQKYGK